VQLLSFLWPGQHLEWEIQEDPGNRNQGSGADPDQGNWQSVVRFDLPTLGKLTATIYLSAGHVQVHVSTPSAGSAAALKAHGAELAAALDSAGSPLDSLIIKQDGQT